MPRYQVTAPDGRTIVLEGDSAPTDADLEEVFRGLPPAQPADKSYTPGTPMEAFTQGMLGNQYGAKQVPVEDAKTVAAGIARYSPALVPGGLPGAAAAGAGEKAAQFIEGRNDPRALGQATGMGAIPFAKLAKAGPIVGNSIAATLAGGTNYGVNKLADAVYGKDGTSAEEQATLVTAITAAMPIVGRLLGKATGNVAPEELARVQAAMKHNKKEDATLAAMRARGVKIRPSDVRQSLRNDWNEMVAGKTNVDNAVSRANEPIVDDVSRRVAQLGPDDVIDEKSLKAVRDNVIYKPYQKAQELGLGEPLQNWQKQTDLLREYNSGPTTVQERIARQSVKADEAKAFADLQKAATDAGHPELADELAKARIQTAENFTVRDAANVGSGHIDARVYRRILEQNGEGGLNPELQDIARFAAAFPEAVKPTAGLSTASSALMGGTVAMTGIPAALTGNVAPAAVATTLPAWRQRAVEKLLSPEYQAKNAVRDYTPNTSGDPRINEIITRLAAILAAQKENQ